MNKNVLQIKVSDYDIGVLKVGNINYISLTDLARYVNTKEPSDVIRNWMSNKNSFSFYNLWEELNNENFNYVESHRIKINEVAKYQLEVLKHNKNINKLKVIENKKTTVE